MNFAAADLEHLMTLLRWRRDVRHFAPGPVPEPVIAQLQQAMALAPSVGNSRPWRVIRVEDQAVRRAVRDEFARCNTEAANAYEGARRDSYDGLKLAGLEQAPVQLAVFCVEDPDAGHGLGRQTMPSTLAQSVSMAIFALWLAARAQNLGVGMVSILDAARIEALMQTPPDWRFAAWLCIGWPAFQDDTPLLHRAGWQENDEPYWTVR
ncbi:MAG: 5,6-dimethylbenzimidazole synthase [Paracoccus sp. (in: a-proteobacteria)]